MEAKSEVTREEAEEAGFTDEQTEIVRTFNKLDNGIPWWACCDIDRWHGHVGGQDEDEAHGSYASYTLLGTNTRANGNRVTVENTEVELILIISRHGGAVFIDAFGEEGVTHYIGIMEGFHETYIAHKEILPLSERV